MSWGTCYNGSNNIHFDFPPIMSDGRNYASWVPACDTNNKLQSKLGLTSNYAYRQYLIKNADKVIESNQVGACDQCCSCPAKYGSTNVNHGKYLYKSCNDGSQPYGYETSDLKNMYLSRRALEERTKAPILSQYGYLVKGFQK